MEQKDKGKKQILLRISPKPVSYTHLDVYKRQVEMALAQLNDDHIVDLDEERKAAMVSNLLVVLCGNKDAQPIVNSGSIY